MEDVFNEQLIKKIPDGKDTAKKAGLIIAGVLVVVSAFIFLSSFAPVVLILIAYGVYYLLSFLDLEYEYIFTNGELDIDCIYKKSRRKHLLSAKVSDFEIFSNAKDKRFENEYKNAEIIKDYSSGQESGDRYFFIYKHEGKRIKFCIEPNEQILKGIRKFMPPSKFHTMP